MNALRTAAWLLVWLLSPGRGGWALKCLFAGVVLKLLWVALIVPVSLVWGWKGADVDAEDLRFFAVEVLLVAPVIETLMMAAVFGTVGRVPRVGTVLAFGTVVVGAALLHEPGARVFAGLMFAAFSLQYVRFREVLPLGAALVGVALTHGTVNAVGVAAALLVVS